MSEMWSLPGYDVQALIGSGAAGEVFRAIETATGETVALKRLRDGRDVESLRRAAVVLSGVETPYVVRLRAVAGSDSEPVLVLDHAAGGSLAALLARRGALDPGEVVTIAAPLAQALAAAHARGLVHGDVSPASVLFTADGMPLLGDLGLVRPGTVDGEPDEAADVRALAGVCHHLLAGSPRLGRVAPTAPRALVEVVDAGLVADPRQRPDAAAFAGMLRRAHAAAPVRLTGGRAAGPVVRPVRRLPAGVLVGIGAVLLLALAAVGGWQLGRAGGAEAAGLPPVAVPAPARPSSPDWSAVLDGLDSARAQAFADGDLGALSSVYARGSRGLASDTALLTDLLERGQTAHGLRHEVRSVELLDSAGDTARLRLVDVLAAYEIRDAAGEVTSRGPARGERAFVVELARTPAGWRLVEVVPEPG